MKKDAIMFILMLLGAVLLFFLAPFLINMLPENARVTGATILYMVVNSVFLIIVGWKAAEFTKYGVWAPGIIIILYLVSELIYFGAPTWAVEANYLETGYIVYFLRKVLIRRKKMEEKEAQKGFPKSVKRR